MKYTAYEKKCALFALYNSMVEYYSNPCNERLNNVGACAEHAYNAHDIACGFFSGPADMGRDFLANHSAQCVRESIKGNAKDGYNSIIKVMSPSTIKKAILIKQNARSMDSVALDMPEEKGKKEKKDKAPMTIEEKIKREEYAHAKRMAKLKYEHTHNGEQNIETKVLEKFVFPSFEEWASAN